MAMIKNGAPQYISLGADDQSGVKLAPEPEATPQHLPLFHIMSPKGTTERVIVNSAQLMTIFGNDTFDKNLGYYNHQTRFLEAVIAEGNNCMIKRIVPEDAGAKANATVYLDVLECPVPNYVRNSNGDLMIDPVNNQYMIDKANPTVMGHKVKWVKEYTDTEEDLGLKVSKTGTMKYLPDTSKLPDSYLKINNIPMLVKALSEFKLEIETNAESYEITTDKPEFLTYNKTTETLQAKAAGEVLVTVRTKDKKFKASKLEFKIEIANKAPTDVASIKVDTDGVFSGDKNGNMIPYTVTLEGAAAFDVISNNFRVASVDKTNNRVVVNSNGETMIGFLGVAADKATAMTVMTVRGSGFSETDIPCTYAEVTSLIPKMKAQTVQVLNIDHNYDRVEIRSDNEGAIVARTEGLVLQARTPGAANIFVKFICNHQPVEEAFELQIPVEVITEDVPDATSLNLNFDKRILSDKSKMAKLDVEIEDGAGLGLDVSDNSMVVYDDKNLTFTGVSGKAGIVMVGGIATKEGKTPVVSYISLFLDMDAQKGESADMEYSTMYPIFELKAKNQGSWYNNIGFAVGSIANESIDSKIISELKALPYTWTFFTRTNPKTSPTIFRNLYAEPSSNIVFVEKAIHPSTEARLDFEFILQNNWFNESDPLKELKYWDYEGFKFYRENFFEQCKKFLEVERPYITKKEQVWGDDESGDTYSWFDFTTDNQEEIKEQFLLLNPFTCKSSKQKMYMTLRLANESSTFTDKQSEVTMSADTPVFLSGGQDGTLSNEEFEKGVVKEMANYLDPDSTYHDLAINTESVLYDSGFTLDTKKELVNFITLRKDTAIIFTDHDASMGEKSNILSDARAIAVAIGNRLKLAPESEYFGTPVCRAMVMVGTGKLRDGTTGDRIPLTYEIAIKAARMMGAANGVWDSSQLFDRENMIEQLTDVQPNFVPSGIKATLWDDGIVWPQPYNRSSFHFPALQTIYSDDTSVLNNYFAMMCLIQLTKLGDRMWRKFTGTATMTNGEFIDAVNTAAMDDLKGRFGGLFNVVVECIIDEQDAQRGYSWHLVTKLYGSTLKTVLVHNSIVYRSENAEG